MCRAWRTFIRGKRVRAGGRPAVTLDTSPGSNTPSARSGPWRPLPRARKNRAGRAAAWPEEPARILPEVLPGSGGARRRRLLSLWPLLVVLAVQAGLSLRLLRAD